MYFDSSRARGNRQYELRSTYKCDPSRGQLTRFTGTVQFIREQMIVTQYYTKPGLGTPVQVNLSLSENCSGSHTTF